MDITLFCLVDEDATSQAFSIEVNQNKTVDHLKNLIKAKKSPRFDAFPADELTLWRVSISVADDVDDELSVLLNNITGKNKRKLSPVWRLSKAFPDEPAEETIHIIVRHSARPPDDLTPEIALLRKQVSDMHDTSISIGVIVKPEKKVAFTWSTIVEDATLDELRRKLVVLYPQYAKDDYIELFFYSGLLKPETISSDEDLRRILKVAKTTFKKTITVALETPTKSFSLWTFKDVCAEYDLSQSADPKLSVIPPFEDIKAAPLDFELAMKMLTQLLEEIESKLGVLSLLGANEATKSLITSAFMVKATYLFKEDLLLSAEENLSGRRGKGPVDFSVHSRKNDTYALGVTEVKKEDFKQGVAQNIVQLESALTSKKRKRDLSDIEGEEVPQKTRSYGIVTDAEKWLFLECTLHEDESVTYRMSELEKDIKFAGADWKQEAEFVFARLVWLWSRMVEEIPARDRYARKSVSSPSSKRIATNMLVELS
ncbi:hypothetical protein EMPS_05657 [Entomortierella parvispora]|uniref:Crinkler effector protein N-terminal domain-containing protein n=1 Tax=Entomortierella parvispora TaxID=205924 RepID=A0A9P3LWQ7_9FUNG|nr:hypothetical protein EMPS_05657 [Entomortierella parvispora]